jgi:formimidoylglutamate deiminase
MVKPMSTILAETILLPDGWANDVRLTIDRGAISKVEIGVAFDSADERHAIVIPGTPNLHSHAFQRVMAGLAEMRGPGSDSFWSWRDVMYRFALSMSPEQVEAVAAQLYIEMLEAGFTRVGEFHYLHHHKDGRPYANLAEMAERIASAAQQTGIGLTLLPVFYAHSGFGSLAPNEGQRRFINDVNRFERLVQASRGAVQTLNQAVVGVAPHSLRAATPDELAAVISLAEGGPVHIHIAEQVKEVDDCIAWSGARPVEWLLANATVDPSWCLIHATHMTRAETSGVASSGAVAGLCPITEANLGDGIFNGPEFLDGGGTFGVGSDSNVLIGVADELRQLEYSQRLAQRARNVLVEPQRSNGRSLFDRALRGGSQALGVSGRIAVGAQADIVSLNHADAPTLACKKDDQILDAWIFAGGTRVDCAWVAGEKLVEGGRHRSRGSIERRFRKAMLELTGA